MLNKVILIGRLTKNPETKSMGENRIPMTSFTLAVERRSGNEKGANVDFIPVNAWRGTAEFVQKYFTKGKQVYVSGRLETFTYEVDGQRRYGFSINAEEVGFADSKRDAGGKGLESAGIGDLPLLSEDDLPF